MGTATKKQNKVPELRFSGFKDDWQTQKLGTIAEVSKLAGYEYTKHITYEDSGEIIALRGLNIKNNSLVLDDVKYIDNSELSKLKRSKLYVDDLMFTYIGTIGEVALINQDNKYYLAPNVSRIRVNDKVVYPKFLLYHFNLDIFKSGEIKKYIASSSQPALSMENVRKFPIRFPILPEQQKIADFLTSVDAWLDNLRQQKTALETYKRGMMQKLFTQQVRFKDENGKDFPEWQETNLGEVFSLVTDYTANGSFAALKDNVKYYSEDNYAVLVRTTDLEKNTFVPVRFTDRRGYDFLKKTFLSGGELIMANVGNIGKVYKAPYYSKPMTLAPNTYMLKVGSGISQEYIYQWMLTKYFLNKTLAMVGGGGLTAINKSNLRSISLTMPSSNIEQQKIADFLTAIDETITAKAEEITKVEQWKKGLMQKMFV